MRCYLKVDTKKYCLRSARMGILAAFSLPIISAALLAQGTGCMVELPAIVVLPDASLVQRLGTGGFVAHDKSGPAKIEAVGSDRNARRILLVVETGKQVPSSARKVQAEILTEILKNARPEDSFALLTMRGPRREIRFGATHEMLTSSIEEIETGVAGKNQEGGALDTIFEGIDWFHPPKAGDAILVLTMGIESNHRVSFAKVRDGLVKARIHLFGFQLGPIIGGYYRTGFGASAFGQTVPTAWIDPNHENLFALSKYTGAFVALENAEGDPWKEYQLTDQRLHAIRHVAHQEYQAIVEFYKIQVQGSPKDLVIDLTDSIRRQLPQAEVSYPRNFPDCIDVLAPARQ
jgi:hypothetical protein